MIHGTPREANSLSPVPSAARPSRTARRMLFSCTCHLQLGLLVGKRCPRTPSSLALITLGKLPRIVEECVRRSTHMLPTAPQSREMPAQQARASHVLRRARSMISHHILLLGLIAVGLQRLCWRAECVLLLAQNRSAREASPAQYTEVPEAKRCRRGWGKR